MNTALIIAAVILVVLFALAVRRVPVAQNYIVKRMGRFHRTLKPGWHVMLPVLDRVAHRISLSGRIVEVKFDVATADGKALVADGLVYFQVLEPRKAMQRIDALNEGARNLAEAATREFVGDLTHDALRHRTGRELNEWLAGLMNESASEWGVRITRIDLGFRKPERS